MVNVGIVAISLKLEVTDLKVLKSSGLTVGEDKVIITDLRYKLARFQAGANIDYKMYLKSQAEIINLKNELTKLREGATADRKILQTRITELENKNKVLLDIFKARLEKLQAETDVDYIELTKENKRLRFSIARQKSEIIRLKIENSDLAHSLSFSSLITKELVQEQNNRQEYVDSCIDTMILKIMEKSGIRLPSWDTMLTKVVRERIIHYFAGKYPNDFDEMAFYPRMKE
jgi:hypothetical protein